MSLSNTTLMAIQQAGAAVFIADAALKNAVRDYGERVKAAMTDNPYNQGNDAMFENWKVVSRLSQTMAGIEEELKQAYEVAADLNSNDQPLLMQVSGLAAPQAPSKASAATPDNLSPTDVIVKSRKRVK